ncbi:MAG: hypothetical protein GQ467_04065 [Mariprofundaceae bacterium]|nr:hypothetical protein [Mariprofundaceae bacterium]
MNGMHDDLHDDGISRLYQKSRIEEPPMGIDSAILSQGRKAVEKRKSLWHRVRWMVPLTSFALAMLTATLFIQMKQEHPEILQSSPTPSSAIQTEEGLKDGLRIKQMDRQKRSIAPMDKETSEKRKASGAPAPAMELKSAPAEMEIAPERLMKAQPKKMMKQKQESMGASQFRSRESLSEADSAAPPQTKALKGQTALTPDVWIEKIRVLFKQGDKDEALKELKAFRIAYPDYQLPADLKTLNE